MKNFITKTILGAVVLTMMSCIGNRAAKTSCVALSPTLTNIDSIMQQRPDSAFVCLAEFSEVVDYDTLTSTDNHYSYLLISEALYKNDAPQMVRAELLVALDFFDSIYKANPKDETAALLSARSHYMNGVGFYENDSVIDACQQFYKALDIIEPFDCNPKFMSLIHTRLANIYSDKFLIEPAIAFYKNALFYKKRDTRSNIANTLFFIGYEFEKGEMADSALYYYDLSLDNNSDTNSLLYRNVINRKAIVMYEIDNDKVKSIKMLKNILETGDDYEKYDRLLGLGYIYTLENQYDTALVYLDEVFNNAPTLFLKTQSANHLYEIYDSLGITEKADFYSRFLTENTPPEFGTKADEWRFTNMFQDYLQQKHQQDLASEYQKKRHDVAMILIVAAVLVTIIAVVLMIRHRRKLLSLTKTVNTEGYNAFIGEPVCKFILNTAHEQQFKAKMDYLVYKEYALNKEQLLSLRMAADKHLNGFTERLMKKYPELTNDDINYCLLYLLGLKEPDIAAFMRKAYSTVSDRNRKLKKIFGSTPDIMTFLQKLTFTVIAMFLSLFLNAQVSVWDGSYEPYDTIHAGTEDDPIIIENAAQLAYMSQLMFTGKPLYYWKLTVDVDLDNREWMPIGNKNAYITSNWFQGFFDGDNHAIYHLTMPLFGYVGFSNNESYVKNIIIKDSDYISQGELNNFGFIAYDAACIENCHNYGNVTLTSTDYLSVGGVCGEADTIINCSNHGTITIEADNIGYMFVGGVVGEVNYIESSYNNGDLNVEINRCNQCRIGGVSGLVYKGVSYSYNTGNITVDCDNSYSGGIVGDITKYQTFNDVSINSCYNAGNIEATNVGGIIAKTDYENCVISVNNCYYIDTIESINDYGIPKSEMEMKTQEFVDLLNNGGNVYAMDLLNVNNGFPVFSSYTSIVENQSQYNALAYPNPARDYIRIELQDDSSCQSIAIYSIDGRLVFETQDAMVQPTTINIANLKTGIYVIKVKLTDGKDYVAKIVKE